MFLYSSIPERVLDKSFAELDGRHKPQSPSLRTPISVARNPIRRSPIYDYASTRRLGSIAHDAQEITPGLVGSR